MQVNFRLKGGSAFHRNPRNPIREINGSISAFQNIAGANTSTLPTLLQHSHMLKAYPFEYTRMSFDECTQDQRQEIFETTKKMLAQCYGPHINLIKQMGRNLIVHCNNPTEKDIVLQAQLQIVIERTAIPVPT